MIRGKIKFVCAICMGLLFMACEKDEDEVLNQEEVFETESYILYSFMRDKNTYLINKDGEVMKSWESTYEASSTCYLSVNKNLLRCGATQGASQGTFSKGGAVGGVIEEIDSDNNVVWSLIKDDDDYTFHHDFKEIDENTIIALSWNLISYNNKEYWNERILIIDKTSNSISWEWSAFDDGGLIPTDQEDTDYLHFNSVDYKDGEVLVSARSKNSLYLIDKESKELLSTFTAEDGLSGQHDATFLDNGNILCFNNVASRGVSSIVELNLDDEVVWEYSNTFFSDHISGTQRLSTGNSLICSGTEPLFIEVTADGEEVWTYVPVKEGSNKASVFKARMYADY